MNPGHLLWILFGPATWGAGGNMVAWVVCGCLGFGWMHAKAEARHAELLIQQERHHRELKAHIASASASVAVPQQVLDDIRNAPKSAVVPQKLADVKPEGGQM